MIGGRGEKIHFFDSAHQAGDYGWHILDDHGLPYAHVFTDPSISAGSDWISGTDAISATVSHEALEMLADPSAAEYSFNGARLMWAHEVCDAVQANTYRIVARGFRVPVSNFVLPAFFNPWADGPYDHLGVLREPFSLAKGGYAILERAAYTRARRSPVPPPLRRWHACLATSTEARRLGSHVLAPRTQPVAASDSSGNGHVNPWDTRGCGTPDGHEEVSPAATHVTLLPRGRRWTLGDAAAET
jgi:hypothetical protein